MNSPAVQNRLKLLSAHLRQRRETLLQLWRQTISSDPQLTTGTGLSRSAFEDHIPSILDDLEHRLQAEHARHAMQVDLQQNQHAAEHGMQRWQQGFDIRETMREWGHLQTVILQELDRYAAEHRDLESVVMSTARDVITRLCMEGNCESASRFMQMQQTEAASRVRDLESSLNALQLLENERAELLREAAHDLRGSVSVIANTTAFLTNPQVPGPERDRFNDLLQHRIMAMSAMLTDLVELSRLEAGRDPLKVESFDAVERVREFCEVLRPAASARKLFVKYAGLSTLPVEGDPLKLQRIVQNLLVNALQATQHGGVTVRCLTGESKSSKSWILSVEDTGPGFTLQAAGELRHALKCATDEAHSAEADAAARKGEAAVGHPGRVAPAGSGPGSAELPSGEGIGLSIVKRLCDVLGATVELETAPARGTTFRITFPLRYYSGTEDHD